MDSNKTVIGIGTVFYGADGTLNDAKEGRNGLEELLLLEHRLMLAMLELYLLVEMEAVMVEVVALAITVEAAAVVPERYHLTKQVETEAALHL